EDGDTDATIAHLNLETYEVTGAVTFPEPGGQRITHLAQGQIDGSPVLLTAEEIDNVLGGIGTDVRFSLLSESFEKMDETVVTGEKFERAFNLTVVDNRFFWSVSVQGPVLVNGASPSGMFGDGSNDVVLGRGGFDINGFDPLQAAYEPESERQSGLSGQTFPDGTTLLSMAEGGGTVTKIYDFKFNEIGEIVNPDEVSVSGIDVFNGHYHILATAVPGKFTTANALYPESSAFGASPYYMTGQLPEAGEITINVSSDPVEATIDVPSILGYVPPFTEPVASEESSGLTPVPSGAPITLTLNGADPFGPIDLEPNDLHVTVVFDGEPQQFLVTPDLIPYECFGTCETNLGLYFNASSILLNLSDSTRQNMQTVQPGQTAVRDATTPTIVSDDGIPSPTEVEIQAMEVYQNATDFDVQNAHRCAAFLVVMTDAGLGKSKSGIRKLWLFDIDGNLLEVFDISTLAAETDVELPSAFALHGNYPNPFNPSTTIRYDLSERSSVTLTVHDLMGRRVATVVNTTQPAGSYTVAWDGRDATGRPAASGMYLARLTADGFTDAKSMVLAK
ncbi:MAG: FlgD immunoglobulin-like domain containing protein, partial [Rhodothermales bacterium]